MIKIPKFFHEILGEFQTKSSLVVIALFVLISGFAIGILGYDEWNGLSLVKQIVTWFLFLDISGGVVANLTKGTDIFYDRYPRKRWVFIAIHIQPIILSWSIGISILYGVIICAYTLITAVFLNFIRDYSFHTLLAGSLTGLGLLIVAYLGQTVPFFASTLLIFYVFKVLFSFSVFHHRGEQNEH
ncbi:hypothetical protein [Alkaliphilus peptidifermentans]|uniref:Uncharacterized protein n=1 Tax=Alkaliphilus peptidifermentans DSM 18978 TaxID=1120976 RepID=A0A1G5E887_9FIRM|nr:hypothetical protein [Alkaliphilus peptidifermentans]SCY22951.1 hypothetical protein SAMN03080606_01075 [Alkaliphilus peptidifermentans DSM 18978]